MRIKHPGAVLAFGLILLSFSNAQSTVEMADQLICGDSNVVEVCRVVKPIMLNVAELNEKIATIESGNELTDIHKKLADFSVYKEQIQILQSQMEAAMEQQHSMISALINHTAKIADLELKLQEKETESAELAQTLSDIPFNAHMIPITELTTGVKNPVDRDTQPLYPSSCVPSGHFWYSGIETIQVHKTRPFFVLCDSELAGPGWIVIQKHFSSKVSFSQNWNTYLKGFGAFDGDFFIGLNILHALTNFQQQELYVQFDHLNGERRIAKYDNFKVGNESENFRLKSLGTFSGNATDFMTYHINDTFSTHDRDNDKHGSKNCASDFNGGWWFKYCAYVNPNGMFHEMGAPFQGIWWANHSNLVSVQMMIRPE